MPGGVRGRREQSRLLLDYRMYGMSQGDKEVGSYQFTVGSLM